MYTVVVTGIGMVSSLGTGVKQNWAAMLAGQDGASSIRHFDASEYTVRKAQTVRQLPAETTPYDLALLAVREALEESGIEVQKQGPERVGLALGTLGGDLRTFERTLQKNPQNKSAAFTRETADTYPLSSILFRLAQQTGIEGPLVSSLNACSSGNHALAQAFDLLQSGEVDVMVAGGCDVVTQTEFTYFHNLRALAPEKCQPFDRNRKGLMIGEGSGILILERLESASRRGAEIYGEMLGYGLSSDGYHVTAPEPSGDGVVRAIRSALEASRVTTEEIDYINAHGTGTPVNDRIETAALKRVFGHRARKIPVSSVKSMVGHTMGAASAIESAVCCLTLRHGVLPPTIHYETADPECDLDYVPNQAREHPAKLILNNSFAFGGNNAVVVFGKL